MFRIYTTGSYAIKTFSFRRRFVQSARWQCVQHERSRQRRGCCTLLTVVQGRLVVQGLSRHQPKWTIHPWLARG